MYFLLDNVLQAPHGGTILKLPGDDTHTRPIDYILGHFDDFNYRDFYHINRIGLLNPNTTKFIFNVVHMPEWVDIVLSQESIKLLNDDPNTYLCIMSVLEYLISPKKLANEIQRLNIPLNKVVVLCSNHEAHFKTIEGIRYICINFWESISRHHHQTLPHTTVTTPDELDIDNAKKKFLCLNRNIKPHRIWLMYSILKSKILEEGHVSYALPDVARGEHEEVSKGEHTLKRIPEDLHDDYYMHLLQNMYTRKLDILDTLNVINYNDTLKPFYNDSVVSVVTESDSTKNFITEKTYKAIMNLHPFFIVGNPEMHTLLRARGYETFEELFGLTQVTNYRHAMVLWHKLKTTDLQILKKKVKEEYLDKLIHNQNLFLSRTVSWKDIKNNLETVLGKN
tara:strand:- start:2873 stop:4054 length:1182 start_codon:yes stop_codon:yes gene_type:complete